MLRRFPSLQVATTCFSCSPPDLNFLAPYFIFMYMHNNHCHRVTVHLQLNILLLLLLLSSSSSSSSSSHHHRHNLLYAGYLYLYSWDKLYPQGVHCCSYSFITIHGAYIDRVSVESIVYYYYYYYSNSKPSARKYRHELWNARRMKKSVGSVV